MHLTEFRQVRRIDPKTYSPTLTLQVRHRTVSRLGLNLTLTNHAASPLGWGRWEDVPIVDDERSDTTTD